MSGENPLGIANTQDAPLILTPCCRVISPMQGEQRKQQRRRQQTEPAVPAGRRKIAHVQLGGRIFSPSEPRPELCAFAPGQHGPPRGLRVLHARPGGPTVGARHARTPAPAAGLLVGTPNLQPCGFGLLKTLFYLTKKKTKQIQKRTDECIRLMYEITRL